MSYTLSRVICTLSVSVLTAYSQPDTQASAGPTIELTRTDLFAIPHWSSKDVCVLGFRLGMTRQEAVKHAEILRMKLMGEDERQCGATTRCYVADQRGLTTGVDLVFGRKGQLSSLSITKIAEDSQPVSGGAPWVHWRLKGSTYDLFSNYSDGLRQKVLGAEASKTTEPITGTLTFRYPQRGAVLEVSPCPEQPPKGYCADITLGFQPPVSP